MVIPWKPCKIMISKISLENNQLITVPRKVIKSILVGNFVVVLTDSNEAGKLNNENVYCYDTEGNELWQIKDLNLFHEEHDYTGIYILDSSLYIYNRCGVEVKIEVETGKILNIEFIK